MTAVVEHQEAGFRAGRCGVRARQPAPDACRTRAGARPAAPGGIRRPATRRSGAELPPVRPLPTVPLVARASHRRRAALAALVVLTAAVVVLGLGLLGLSAQHHPGLPAATSVVQVGPGESLADVARRVAPGADSTVVVEWIRQLNRLSSSVVHAGQAVAVPVPG